MTSIRTTQSVVLAGMLLAGASSAHSQTCMGLPSLDLVSRSVSTVADAWGSQRAVLGRVGVNSRRVFAGVQAGYAGNKLVDPDKPALGVDAGMTFSLGGGPKAIQLCPLIQSLVQFENGPGSTTHSTLGLSLGRQFTISKKVAITPYIFGGLSRWDYSAQRFSTSALPGTPPTTAHYSETGARFGTGFGLRLGDQLTIRPQFFFPAGYRNSGNDANQPGASLSISYGFRR